MEPEEFQQAGQADAVQTRVRVDADLLLKELRRQQRQFQGTIFWRDFREVVIGLLLIPIWLYMGITASLPWTWYLTVPVFVWMAGFMLVYRRRHAPQPVGPDEPLLPCVKNSLTEAEAQIWLLRNVFWWYLLPPSVSISAFFIQVGLSSRAGGWLPAVGGVLVLEAMLAAVYGAIYFLNRYCVRSQLEPRRQELLRLLANLRDETRSEIGGEYPILLGANRRIWGRRQWAAWILCFVGLLLIAIGGFILGSEPTSNLLGFVAFALIGIAVLMLLASYSLAFRLGRPKESPAAAESQADVKVGEEWLELVSLDTRRRKFAAGLGTLVVLLTIAAFTVVVLRHPHGHGHPESPSDTERSPFTAVRWQESRPEIRVGDEWFQMVSLDGIPAFEIVAFSQRDYGDRWRMRFEEDLVALLTQMGHPPADTVTLIVQSLTSPERRTLKDVPMTNANRQVIKAAALAR